MKILLAVDSSACSELAVYEVAQRPWPAGTEVYLISVVELPFVPTEETHSLPESYYSQLEKAAQEEAHAAIAKTVERLGESHITPLHITTSIIVGHPEDVILAEAEAWGADLIVLGSHGYRGWKRWLLGSVSQAVAARARCSVEIVRSRKMTEISLPRPQQATNVREQPIVLALVLAAELVNGWKYTAVLPMT